MKTKFLKIITLVFCMALFLTGCATVSDVLDKNGKYRVRHPVFGDSEHSLSQSEQIMFRYLCFLRTAEFWCGFEELRNLHSVKKPLIIKDLFERLDESVNTEELMQRTEKLQRQVIILNCR